MSLRRLGKCASDGLRPRAAKLSRQIRPCSNSRVPLRIVSRFQPRSRSARRCPPDPSSLTVRAMNNRRALPFSALAVSMNKALNESVTSIVGSPALLSLECMIHHLGWFNFCVSLTALRAPSRVEDRFDDCFGHWVWRICAYRALAADGLRNAHCARLLPVLIAFLFVSGDWSTTTLGRDVLLYVIRSDRDVEHVES